MNFFKVLASGKHKLREEFISSFLAYLLSPKMDHGLGAILLLEIVERLSKQHPSLIDLENDLWQVHDTFRENIFEEASQQVSVELEFKYPTSVNSNGYIDIVIRVNDWFIVIEVKILHTSLTNNQIMEQYNGIKRILQDNSLGSNNKVLFLYLVPAQRDLDNWTVTETFVNEIDFAKEEHDIVNLIAWQPTADNEHVSMVDILKTILQKDLCGDISPLSNDVKHAIKSFISFTMDEFHGYHYDKTANPKQVRKMEVRHILNSTSNIFLGPQYGMAGLITQAWKNPNFKTKQINTSDTKDGWQYMDINTFKTIASWAMDPDHHQLTGIDWKGRPFGVKVLYKVAKTVGNEIKIGLKGGLKTLTDASPEEILSGKFAPNGCPEISTTGKNNANWFDGNDFTRVLEEKGISFD